MSKISNEERNHQDHQENIKDNNHDHSHGHSHEHKHNHNSQHEDPFANPSRLFVWKYAFRNYIRRRSYYKELMQNLNPKGSETVLDFGSGTGTFAKKLAPKLKDGQLYCLDTSASFLVYTKKQLKRYNNVQFLFGEIMNQNLPSKSFDYIVSTWVLHHLDKDILVQTIKGFKSVLKENGKIFIIEFPDQYENMHHIHSVIRTSDILDLFTQNNFSYKILYSREAGVLYELSN